MTTKTYPVSVRLAEKVSDAERVQIFLVDAQKVGDVPGRPWRGET